MQIETPKIVANCILFQVHVIGIWKALPLLKHNARVYNFGSPTPFLLNSQVTFALYILSTLLVLASSIVLYFYGHTRYVSETLSCNSF